MKKKLITLFCGIILSFTTVSARYIIDPTLCDGVGATWDATTRKFTINGLHESILAPWVTLVLSPEWEQNAYVDITNYNYTPGETTVTTFALPIEYGDPLIGGLTGNYKLAVEIIKIQAEQVKCGKYFDVPYWNNSCVGKSPTYCSNFNMSVDGPIIYLEGTNNCAEYNRFFIANDDYSLHAELPITYSDSDKRSIAKADMTNVKLRDGKYTGIMNAYPYQQGFKLYMNSDDWGLNAHGSNFCSKSFDLPVITSTSDINTHSITILPNPATSYETITIKGEYASNAKVSITSPSGSTVGSVIPSVGADAMAVSLSGLNLQAGIYFVRIDSGEKVYVSKLCVK